MNLKEKFQVLENHNFNEVLKIKADGSVYHRGKLVPEEIVLEILAPFVKNIKEDNYGK